MSKNVKKTAKKANTSKATVISGNASKGILQFSMYERFTTIFVLSIFAVFPFYMTDKLFNVRGDRLHFFVAAVLILLFFILATFVCGIDKEKRPTNIFKLSISDISFIAFTVICLVSACLSEYGEEAFTGSGGRDSGFWLMLMYLLCYLLVSRFFRSHEITFTVFAIASSVVCLIAIMHEFFIDPFNIISDIKQSQQKDFITTIGNINMFSGYICVTLSTNLALAVISKDNAFTAFYCFTVSLNFMGLLVANSLSGYFGLAVFMTVLFVYCCGNSRRLFKFFTLCSVMLISAKVLRLISYIFNDKYKNLQDVSKFLIFDSRVYILLAITIVLTIGAYFLQNKFGENHSPKWVTAAAGSIAAAAAFCVVGALVYFTFIDTETDLGNMAKILRLNDQWGTHRGFAWIRGFKLFTSSGIKNFLVGSGPDTFGQLIKSEYRDEMISRYDSIFDTAHNEFLNYLVTTGLLGFISYVTLIFSVVIKCIRRCTKDPVMLIPILVITAYASQSLFNLATPIITPYLFLFIGIGENMIRLNDNENHEVI